MVGVTDIVTLSCHEYLSVDTIKTGIIVAPDSWRLSLLSYNRMFYSWQWCAVALSCQIMSISSALLLSCMLAGALPANALQHVVQRLIAAAAIVHISPVSKL